MAAGGLVTFCLDTKSNQKNQVIRQLADSLPHRAFAHKAEKTLGCNLFTPLRSRNGRRFSKKLLCPAHRTALPVFSAFSRSLPADKEAKRRSPPGFSTFYLSPFTFHLFQLALSLQKN